MIHSSTIAGHHFLLSRRRGYEPAEVDAVIRRLVATLQEYEEREARLAQRGKDADVVTDLETVRAARQRTLDNAEAVGHQLELQARTKLDRVETEVAERLAEAEDEAERIIAAARHEAEDLLSRRSARVEVLVTAALSEVKALRARVLRETNEFRAGKKKEATALVKTAELQAAQLVEDARHEAGSMLGRARREHTVLEQRIGQLRSAIAEIEGEFRYPTEPDLEQATGGSPVVSHDTEEPADEAEPEVVRLTQQRLTVDLTDGNSEEDLPSPPVHERYAVTPGETLYKRRGAGLRRRIEREGDANPDQVENES